MTNAEIIFSESMRLMNDGIIGTTGRKLTLITLNDDGTENREIIDEPEEIHTFAEWKALGFMVQKGQKAIAKFTIWNFTDKPSKAKKATREAAGEDTEAADPHFYMKDACFFAFSQVAPLKDKEQKQTERPTIIDFTKVKESKKETKEAEEVKETEPEKLPEYVPTEEEKSSFIIDFNYIDSLLQNQ